MKTIEKIIVNEIFSKCVSFFAWGGKIIIRNMVSILGKRKISRTIEMWHVHKVSGKLLVAGKFSGKPFVYQFEYF